MVRLLEGQIRFVSTKARQACAMAFLPERHSGAGIDEFRLRHVGICKDARLCAQTGFRRPHVECQPPIRDKAGCERRNGDRPHTTVSNQVSPVLAIGAVRTFPPRRIPIRATQQIKAAKVYLLCGLPNVITEKIAVRRREA